MRSHLWTHVYCRIINVNILAEICLTDWKNSWYWNGTSHSFQMDPTFRDPFGCFLRFWILVVKVALFLSPWLLVSIASRMPYTYTVGIILIERLMFPGVFWLCQDSCRSLLSIFRCGALSQKRRYCVITFLAMLGKSAVLRFHSPHVVLVLTSSVVKACAFTYLTGWALGTWRFVKNPPWYLSLEGRYFGHCSKRANVGHPPFQSSCVAPES